MTGVAYLEDWGRGCVTSGHRYLALESRTALSQRGRTATDVGVLSLHVALLSLSLCNFVMSTTAAYGLPTLNRITRNPEVMTGKACIRGMRVTVATVVGLVAAGYAHAQIVEAYPYIEDEDIRQALAYAAWRVEEIEISVPAAYDS
jgi:uncharacterized protein (DUF433 family)